MTTEEFSNEFDALVDSYRRFKNFDDLELLDSLEFNEYEKSVFLTKALEELVILLYNGKNPYGDSFEKTEEVRRSLDALIKTARITTLSILGIKIANNSTLFTLPEDLLFITYESATITSADSFLNNKNLMVYPVTLDDFYKIEKNPFRKSNNRRILRLDHSKNTVELISDYTINTYIVRYLAIPEPIVLVTLNNGLSINNISNKNECKLSSNLHRLILENAVTLALLSKGITGNK